MKYAKGIFGDTIITHNLHDEAIILDDGYKKNSFQALIIEQKK